MTSIQKIRVWAGMGISASVMMLFIALQSPSNILLAAFAGMFFGGNAALWLIAEIHEILI